MINPLVDTRIEVPDGCPITAERHNGGMRFVLGGIQDALDIPLDVVFQPRALRRFVELAAEMIAESAAVDHDGPP